MHPRHALQQLKNVLGAFYPGQWSVCCTDHGVTWRIVRVNYLTRTTVTGSFCWEALRSARFNVISDAIINIKWWKVEAV